MPAQPDALSGNPPPPRHQRRPCRGVSDRTVLVLGDMARDVGPVPAQPHPGKRKHDSGWWLQRLRERESEFLILASMRAIVLPLTSKR